MRTTASSCRARPPDNCQRSWDPRISLPDTRPRTSYPRLPPSRVTSIGWETQWWCRWTAQEQRNFGPLMEWDSSFNYYGSAIAQLSLPSLALESITLLSNVPSGNVVHWGTAIWLDGSYGNNYLYVYGIEDNAQNGRFPFIALTNPAVGVSGVANTNNWYVWNGNSWEIGR